MTQVAEGNFMVNTIEYGKIRFALSDERKDLVALIRQAEAAERYEDMCLFSRRLALLARATMTREERNLFTIAHRHVLSAKRAAWRTMVGFHKIGSFFWLFLSRCRLITNRISLVAE